MDATPGEINQRLTPVARRPQELRSKIEGRQGTVFYPRLAPPPFGGRLVLDGRNKTERQLENAPAELSRISRRRQAQALPRR